MQNPQQTPQMAQMAAMNANGGPVNDVQMMGNMQHQQRMPDPQEQLNTYIYDYFLRNENVQAARAMLESPNLKVSTTGPPGKRSPKNRPNGVDSMDSIADMPQARLPQGQVADNSFLLDWWQQFWDIFQATRSRGSAKGSAYINHTRVTSLCLTLAHGGALTSTTEPCPAAE